MLAWLPASLVTATGLVPDSGRYLPTAVVLAPLGLICALWWIRGRARAVAVERRLLVVLVAYVAWCGLAAITSVARGTSMAYLGGIVVTLALIYVAAPVLIADDRARRWVLAVVTVMGLACAAVGLALAMGPWTVFGQALGQYEIIEITVLGNPTGLIVLRVIGPFLASNGQGINCALGLIAVIALRAGARGRAHTVATISAVALLVALLD